MKDDDSNRRKEFEPTAVPARILEVKDCVPRVCPHCAIFQAPFRGNEVMVFCTKAKQVINRPKELVGQDWFPDFCPLEICPPDISPEEIGG